MMGRRGGSVASWTGKLPFLLMALLVVALVAGALTIYLRLNSQQPVEILLATPTPKDIKVYLTGAISRPGVYALTEGDRLEDAIRAAGGATSDADLPRVNLSLRIKDEGQYQVPRKGEPLALTSESSSASGKVNINTATQEELETLPGIGEVRAKAIIDYRQINGPFVKPDDLLKVNGIGTGIFQMVRDLITTQ